MVARTLRRVADTDWTGWRTVGYHAVTGVRPGSTRLSQTPSPDEPQPVSGQPWSSPSGDPMSVEPYRPPAPHQPLAPVYQPGQAPLPQPPEQSYPPTSQFPAQPGYGPGYPPPGYDSRPPPDYHAGPQAGYSPGQPPPGYPAPGYDPRPPRKSSIPIVAVIIAVALLLCGGGATATVLIARAVTDKAKEVVKPITPPAIPTQAPDIPDIPNLPTDLPNLPGGAGRPITVTYEVTGDGPAEIIYTGPLGQGPKRVSNADLPWRLTTTIEGAAFVSVTAARLDGDNGSISCHTTIDDDSASQSTRQGGFAAVSCGKFVYN